MTIKQIVIFSIGFALIVGLITIGANILNGVAQKNGIGEAITVLPPVKSILGYIVPRTSTDIIGSSTVNFYSKTATTTAVCFTGTQTCMTSPASGSSPLTTKGDIYVYSTINDRLPIGTNGYLLQASSSQSTGLVWVATSTLGFGSGSMTYPGVGVAVSTGSAWDTSLSSTTWLMVSKNLSDLNNSTTARTNLGLGSLATQNTPASGIVTSNGSALSNITDSSTNWNTAYTNASTSPFANFVKRSDWTTIDNYPAACGAGQVVSGIGDTLTCIATSTNANTATALLADPTDCATGVAIGIAASGNLTCTATTSWAGAGSQTPWTSNINGGGYSLSNVLNASTTNLSVSGYTYLSGSTTIGSTIITPNTSLNGSVLKSDGTNAYWVATSTLGFGSGSSVPSKWASSTNNAAIYPSGANSVVIGATATSSLNYNLMTTGNAWIDNLSIGATTPSGPGFPLDIKSAGGASTVSYINVQNTSASTNSGTAIEFSEAGGNGAYSKITSVRTNSPNAGDGSFNFYSSSAGTIHSSPDLTLLSSGNVGIGTSSPYSKLTIWGSDNLLELSNTSSSTKFLVTNTGSTTIGSTIITPNTSLNGSVLKSDGTNAYWVATSTLGISGGSMTYPGAGVAVSTGSAWDTSLASTTWLMVSKNLSDLNNTTSARTNLGLANLATQNAPASGIVTSNGTVLSNITDGSTNWNTAYTQTERWNGGSTDLVAATGRTSLGLGTMAVENNLGTTTITTLGTITTGTWSGTAIAANKGGTGQTTFGIGDLLYSDTASTLNKLATSTRGALVGSSLSTGLPSYFATNTLKIALSDTTGIETAAQGGTGQSTYGIGDLLYSDTATSLAKLATSTKGSVLMLSLSTGLPSYMATGSLGITATIPTQPWGATTTGDIWYNGTNPRVGIGTNSFYASTLFGLASSSNSYLQQVLKNTSANASSSVDYVLENNLGTDTSYFMNMGLNSSTWASNRWTINGANDGYLYNSDGNLSMGTASTTGSKYINFFTSGTLAANERMRIDSTGLVGIGTTSPASTLSVQATTGQIKNIFTLASSTNATVFSIDSDGHFLSAPTAVSTNAFTINNASGNQIFNIDNTIPTMSSKLFQVGTTTPANNYFFSVMGNGHWSASSTVPVVSSCGTSPSIVGSDNAFTVTVGTIATGCTITFAYPFVNTPVCTVTSQSATSSLAYSKTTSAVTLTDISLSSDIVDVICIGSRE